MSEPTPSSPDSEARNAQWEADRAQESTPLPYADQPKYRSDTERQIDLSAAEEKNVAKAAGELGLTSSEWRALRQELGRSPGRGDVKK